MVCFVIILKLLSIKKLKFFKTLNYINKTINQTKNLKNFQNFLIMQAIALIFFINYNKIIVITYILNKSYANLIQN